MATRNQTEDPRIGLAWQHGATASWLCSAGTISVSTRRHTEFVDITDISSDAVNACQATGGMVWLFCSHTSCGLLINENETGLEEDAATVLDEITPIDRYRARNDRRRRPENLVDGEQAPWRSHVRATMTTHPCLSVPIVNGNLALGRWQRIFLLELDGAHEREVHIQIWSRSADHPAVSPDGRNLS